MKKFLLIFPALTVFSLFLNSGAALAEGAEVGSPVKIEFPEIQLGKPPPDWKPDLQVPIAAEKLAEMNPRLVSLFATDLSLDKGQTNARAGGAVTGSFQIKNGSTFAVYGVRYSISLAEKSRANIPSSLKDVIKNSQNFSVPISPYVYTLTDYKIEEKTVDLPIGGALNKNFSFSIPNGLVSGDYILWVTLYPERGQSFVSNELPLYIGGSEKSAVNISDAYFVKKIGAGSPYFSSRDRLPYEPNEAVVLLFNIKNDLFPFLELRPHAVIRKHSYAGPVVKEPDLNPFTLQKGEYSAKFDLPAVNEAGKYFATVYFSASVGSNNAEKKDIGKLADISRLSYIVKGDQAEIQSIFVEQAGADTGKIGVRVEGLPYPDADLGDVAIKLKITDLETNRVLSEAEKNTKLTGVNGDSFTETAYFDLGSIASLYPQYEATVSKAGKVLDSYAIEPNGQPSKPEIGRGGSTLLIISLLVLLFIALGGWFLTKQKNMPGKSGMIIILLFFIGVLGITLPIKARAAVTGYVSYGFWGGSHAWYNPSYNSAFSANEPIPAYIAISENVVYDGGSCKGGGSSGSMAYVVVSDGLPKYWGYSTSYFFNGNAYPTTAQLDNNWGNTNYKYLGPINSQSFWQYTGCHTTEWGWVSGYKNAPESGSKGSFYGGPVNYFVIFANNSLHFVGYEKIRLTPLSYKLAADPLSRIVGPNQTAPYQIQVIPDEKSFPVIGQPASLDFFSERSDITIFDYLSGYNVNAVSGGIPYWDNPGYLTGYKPGDMIRFSSGANNLEVAVNTPYKCNNNMGSSGGAFAVALISDGEPKDINTLTFQNIADQFASTTYRSLGPLNASFQYGLKPDCTVWYQWRVWGDKPAPSAAVMCSPSGNLVPFDGRVNAYVITESGVGRLIQHQTIRISPTATPSPPNLETKFAEPVSLSTGALTGGNQCPSGCTLDATTNICYDTTTFASCGVPSLDPGFYDLSYAPSNISTSTSTDVGLYDPVTLNIKLKDKTSSQYTCSAYPGCSPTGQYCYDPDGNYCGPATLENVIKSPPPGDYTFKVKGVSGGAVPGLTRYTTPLTLEVTNNPPPDAFDNLRVDGAGSCKSVPLAWDSTNFGPLGRVIWPPSSTWSSPTWGTIVLNTDGTGSFNALPLTYVYLNDRTVEFSVGGVIQGEGEGKGKSYKGTLLPSNRVIQGTDPGDMPFTANLVSPASIRVSQASDNYYRLTREGIPGSPYPTVVFPNIDPSVTAYVDNAVNPLTPYRYYVEAFNSFGSTKSNSLAILTPLCADLTAIAQVSSDGVNFGNTINVAQGALTPIYLSAAESTSTDWIGMMASGGKCEWNSDLSQGPPTFETTINNPADPSACNISLGNLTFNDPFGTYTYDVLRLTDKDGKVSNVGSILVTVSSLLPNLIVQDITYSGSLTASSSITLSGTIKNIGGVDATSSVSNTFTIDLNNSTFTNADITLPPQSISSLAAGGTAVASVPWANIPVGTHTIKVCANEPPNPAILVVDQSDGHNCKTLTITVSSGTQPTLSFFASPPSINYTQSAILQWSSLNTTSCSASGGWAGSKPTSGSETVTPNATTTYTLTCSGPNGSVSRSVTVSVTIKPKICEVNPADPICK